MCVRIHTCTCIRDYVHAYTHAHAYVIMCMQHVCGCDTRLKMCWALLGWVAAVVGWWWWLCHGQDEEEVETVELEEEGFWYEDVQEFGGESHWWEYWGISYGPDWEELHWWKVWYWGDHGVIFHTHSQYWVTEEAWHFCGWDVWPQ